VGVFVMCVNKMGWQNFEERCATKLRVRLGKSATVTCGKLQRACRKHTLSRAQIRFRRPRKSGKRTSCGKTFDLKNGRHCGKGEVSCEV
jgi:hypothetical protein